MSGSATGHVITGVSAVVGFAAKLVYDKIDTTSKQLSASQAAAQAENTKRFDKLDFVLSSVAPQMAAMDEGRLRCSQSRASPFQ